MRILLYGLNYSPELTGIGKYSGEMGAWLMARGHEVRVVTAPPYYPAWRVTKPYRGGRYRKEAAEGGSIVYRCPIYVPTVPSGLRRMMHLMSFMLSSVPVMARLTLWEPEVIFSVEPTFFCAPVTLSAGAATGAPCWLHIQDFEVEAAFELGLLPSGGWLQRFASVLEGFLLRRFERISSISSPMVERMQARGVERERTLLFPNWVDTDFIVPIAGKSRLREKLGLEDRIVLLYSGNLGNKQGLEMLDPLCEMFRNDPRVHFLICGDGSLRPHLEELAETHPNLTLLPLQPLERLNDLLNTADIHLLPQRADAADLVMPSKLTGMLASGRPVIATADPGAQVALIVGGNHDFGTAPTGLVVPPNDVRAFSAAIQKLVEDSGLRANLGVAARAFAVEHLGKEAILLRFERELQELVSRTNLRVSNSQEASSGAEEQTELRGSGAARR